MTVDTDFEPVDWYQYDHLRMIESFNVSGIIGAKFCENHLCNLPDPSMNIELISTSATDATTTTTSTTTSVKWNGFTWPRRLPTENWNFSLLEVKDGFDQTTETGIDQNQGCTNSPYPGLLIFLIYSLAIVCPVNLFL